MENNIGNVIGLAKRFSEPLKKYILWAAEVSPGSEEVELRYYNFLDQVWQPLVSSATPLATDIAVSLSGGKTLGKFKNGDIIPAAGKTTEEVLRMMAIESIYPTYVPATLFISQSAAVVGEVGESVINTVTATFNQNDAGSLAVIRIQKDGSDLTPNGTTSPFSKTKNVVRILGDIAYHGFSNYNAGSLKIILPDNIPDNRAPAIRSINAPQAAENDFASAVLHLTGVYKLFYGPIGIAPSNSNSVRSLPFERLSNVGNTWTLNTGIVHKTFVIAMPATNSLISVVDLDALNANLTANYILSTFNVNDAGETPVAYKVYTMNQAVAYGTNHRHLITIS